MNRINARVNVNGTTHTIEHARPDLFAEWLRDLVVGVTWYPSTLFRVERLDVAEYPE